MQWVTFEGKEEGKFIFHAFFLYVLATPDKNAVTLIEIKGLLLLIVYRMSRLYVNVCLENEVVESSFCLAAA